MSIFFHDSCSIRCGLIFIFLDHALTNFPLYKVFHYFFQKVHLRSNHARFSQSWCLVLSGSYWAEQYVFESQNLSRQVSFCGIMVDFEFAAQSKNWEKIENNNTFILKRVFSCKSGLLSHFHFSFRFSLRLRLAQVRVTSEFAKFAGVEPKLSKKANRYFYSRFVFCVDYWYELGVPTRFE